MRFRLWAVLGLLALTVSCATYRLQAVGPAGSHETVDTAQAVRGDLTVSARADLDPDFRFDVTVTNGSTKAVALDVERSRLFVGDLKHWSEVPLLAGEDYLRRQQQRAAQMTIVSTEPTVYRRTTQTTTIVGSNGQTVFITRNDPVYVAEPSRSVVVVAGPSQAELDWLRQNLLQSTSVAAGETKRGYIYANGGRGSYYKLVVTVDHQDFELIFQRVKDKNSSVFKNVDW